MVIILERFATMEHEKGWIREVKKIKLDLRKRSQGYYSWSKVKKTEGKTMQMFFENLSEKIQGLGQVNLETSSTYGPIKIHLDNSEILHW